MSCIVILFNIGVLKISKLTCEKVEAHPGEKLNYIEHPEVGILDENL